MSRSDFNFLYDITRDNHGIEYSGIMKLKPYKDTV